MTVVRAAATTTSLTAAGTQDNPLIAWYNRAADATNIATVVGTEQTDGEATNLAYASTYDQWSALANVGGSAYVRFYFSSAVNVSVCAIAAHNIGTLGGTVDWQYSTDGGSTWNDTAAGSTSPSDDQAIIWHHPAIDAADWRLRVTGLTGSVDIVTVGVAFISYSLIPGDKFFQGYTPPITQTNVALQSNVSEGGHFIGSSVVRKGSSASATLQHLPGSDVRANSWKNFQRYFNEGGPFFWAWRPGTYGDAFLAKRNGDEIRPTNSGPKDYMSAVLNMSFYDDVG